MSGRALDSMFASLTGLSVGDAFGQRFFSPAVAAEHLEDRSLPPAPWHWTDDTNMALSIVDVLVDHGTVDQDALAVSFGAHFEATRGYGAGMHRLLPKYAVGADWRRVANRLFGGMGSYGNGAAMRVAPLGAYFGSDLERVAAEAGKSAAVTHAHREAIAGAIAVAIAAAIATGAPKTSLPGPSMFTESVITFTPASEVRQRLTRIGDLTPSSSLADAVALLGNGSRITAQDTVPFCVWVASHHLDDYPAALWLTVRARGDIDTTSAIVGGIIAARTRDVIPSEWITRREPLPGWAPVTHG